MIIIWFKVCFFLILERVVEFNLLLNIWTEKRREKTWRET